MSDITVRDATPADLAFLADSNAAMALETEAKTLDRATLERGVAAVFARPERGFYLIAERAGRAVGCLMVTYEWSDWRCGTWWWLQSVYVVADARRSGAFRRLFHEIERRARSGADDVIGLRLYVEKSNLLAQATYAELGMTPTAYDVFESSLGRGRRN
ncbi:MAG TPA: GNAT family N-acetyltransferase [Dokdonella sp.]